MFRMIILFFVMVEKHLIIIGTGTANLVRIQNCPDVPAVKYMGSDS